MNEDQIERKVERITDLLDARYMHGELTTEQYHAEMTALGEWADTQYDRVYRAQYPEEE